MPMTSVDSRSRDLPRRAGAAPRDPGAAVAPRLVIALAVILAAVAALAFVADRLLRPGAFAFEHVRVEGEMRNVDLAQVEAAVNAAVSGNFFSVDLAAVEHAVEAVFWVDDAEVQRRWPDTLIVSIDEARIFGRWGADRWLTVDGNVVRLPADVDIPGVPSLYGPEGTEQQVLERHAHWSPVFKSIGLTVRSLTLSPRHTWQLVVGRTVYAGHFVTGGATEIEHEVAVRVGKEHPDGRVARFAQVFARTLAGEFHRIDAVDLRYPNGFTITWDTEVGQAAGKQSTKAPENA